MITPTLTLCASAVKASCFFFLDPSTPQVLVAVGVVDHPAAEYLVGLGVEAARHSSVGVSELGVRLGRIDYPLNGTRTTYRRFRESRLLDVVNRPSTGYAHPSGSPCG